jgi:hypothetical protein
MHHERFAGEVFLKTTIKMKNVIGGSHVEIYEKVDQANDARDCQKTAFRNRN